MATLRQVMQCRMTTRRTIACLLSNEIRTNSNQPATEGGISRGQTTACRGNEETEERRASPMTWIIVWGGGGGGEEASCLGNCNEMRRGCWVGWPITNNYHDYVLHDSGLHTPAEESYYRERMGWNLWLRHMTSTKTPHGRRVFQKGSRTLLIPPKSSGAGAIEMLTVCDRVRTSRTGWGPTSQEQEEE